MQFGSRPVALVHGPWRHPTRGSTRECQVAASPDLPRVRMVSCDWERGGLDWLHIRSALCSLEFTFSIAPRAKYGVQHLIRIFKLQDFCPLFHILRVKTPLERKNSTVVTKNLQNPFIFIGKTQKTRKKFLQSKHGLNMIQIILNKLVASKRMFYWIFSQLSRFGIS